jgi:hypothetical protein
VLIAQVLTTVVVAVTLTAISGLTVLVRDGLRPYQETLVVVPIMAVFGAAVAAIVRRASWLLLGFAVWFVFVEALIGHLRWPLPISAYLQAVGGDAFSLLIFVIWAVVALAVAAVAVTRDFAAD